MSRKHILIVEDEIAVQNAIREVLKGEYHLGFAATIQEAYAYLKAHAIDLLLLDLQLGHENGMAIARHVREQSPHVAIVILTGKGSLQSAIQAIELNAQGYLLKPVSPNELETLITEQLNHMDEMRQRDELVRHMWSAMKAIGGNSIATKDHRLVSGDMVLDRERYEARYAGDEVTLTITQFRVLWRLVEAEGEIVTPHQLASEAMGYDVSEQEASELVRGHISKIRRQIAVHAGDREHIRTIHGQGYVWIH